MRYLMFGQSILPKVHQCENQTTYLGASNCEQRRSFLQFSNCILKDKEIAAFTYFWH